MTKRWLPVKAWMKLAASVAPLHRNRGQLQAGDPAFGAVSSAAMSRPRVEAHHLVEEFGGLGGGEAQVGRAQFGQLAAGAQPGQG